MNSFKVNKVIRTNDMTYRTVDEALERTIPLDVLDIIIGYDRHDKTHFQPQLLEQVQKNEQNSEEISPIFSNRVKYMLGKINHVDGRLNKMCVCLMLFDYICDFRFLYRDISRSFMNVVKNKLNFFYFTEKIVNAHIYYSNITGDDIDPDNSIIPTGTRHRLCSLCKLPGHDKRTCEKVDLFTVNKGKYISGGFNWYGYNVDGYDREGRTCDGYDRDGYDRNGYDRGGYDRNGYDRSGYDREDRDW